jgi:hypothetical protein
MIISTDAEKAFDKIQHKTPEQARNTKNVSQHKKGYI